MFYSKQNTEELEILEHVEKELKNELRRNRKRNKKSKYIKADE